MYMLLTMVATFILIYAGSYATVSVDASHRLMTAMISAIVAAVPSLILTIRDRRKKRDAQEMDDEIAEWSRNRRA